MKTRFNINPALIAILVVAAFFRFYNINWDQGYHLHPDERFLTLVANSMRLPGSLFQYLDPAVSPFNPANIGYRFYVYGIFPVTVTKLISVLLNADNYNNFTILGRYLSGLSDLIIVFLIYKTLLLLEKAYKLGGGLKYWGSFLYTFAVLPIQLSHFFAVDTFLNLFLFASFYEILKFHFHNKRRHMILSAVFLGLALATKITAIFLIPLVMFFLVFPFLRERSTRNARTTALSAVTYSLSCYFILRLSDPYLFQSSNFFDPRISSLFIENLKTLSFWSSPNFWYPPGVQWLHKTPLFPLVNIIFFGLGIPYYLIITIGIAVILVEKRRTVLLPVFLWLAFFFFYQSLQVSKTMRYFLIFYPYFAIFAALGLEAIIGNLKKTYKTVIAVLLIISWPLAFFSIYMKPHTRILASEWISKNLPDKSLILSEYWDDGLPLQPKGYTNKTFFGEPLPVFDPDTPEKWQKMNTMLSKADYYVLSSNRAWGSIPSAPERYPLMSIFYRDFLAGKKGYKKIKEFSSYPSFRYLGIPINFPDDFAEEVFTVNDHPKVMIFKRETGKSSLEK